MPLGTVVTPAGLRAGKSAGRLVIHGETGTSEVDLLPGGLQLIDLPPGQLGIAEFRFRDQVDLGRRAKHARIEVGGGLGGLLIDLRDVPLHLPDRLERRRALLACLAGGPLAGPRCLSRPPATAPIPSRPLVVLGPDDLVRAESRATGSWSAPAIR